MFADCSHTRFVVIYDGMRQLKKTWFMGFACLWSAGWCVITPTVEQWLNQAACGVCRALSAFPQVVANQQPVCGVAQGVVKALFDQNLLPRVLAGSSVGSIGERVACILVTFRCSRLRGKQVAHGCWRHCGSCCVVVVVLQVQPFLYVLPSRLLLSRFWGLYCG